MEIIITIAIVASAVYLLYRNIKRKAEGKCDCGSCTSKCPKYDNKN